MTARAGLTREAIVAAARDLVAEEGLGAVSLPRVAARVGVTAPALYAHVWPAPVHLAGPPARWNA